MPNQSLSDFKEVKEELGVVEFDGWFLMDLETRKVPLNVTLNVDNALIVTTAQFLEISLMDCRLTFRHLQLLN